MKASCTRVHCFRFIRVRKRHFRTRRRLVPALDLAADLDLDFGWVAVKDDVDGMLDAGTEDETAFHQIRDIVGKNLDQRLAVVDALRDDDGGEDSVAFLLHRDGLSLAVVVFHYDSAAEIHNRVRHRPMYLDDNIFWHVTFEVLALV